MKTKRLKLAAMCIAVTLCGQLSQGQQNDQRQNQQPQYGSAQASDSANGLHLSKMIGAPVKSNNGENLGKLEDVVIDPRTGKVRFAIVGKGGVLRLGEKRMPVPWQAITIDSQKRLTLNVDKEKLQSAPTTAQADDTDLDNPDFVVLVYKFYEIAPPSVGSGETPGGTQRGTSRPQTDPNSSKP